MEDDARWDEAEGAGKGKEWLMLIFGSDCRPATS